MTDTERQTLIDNIENNIQDKLLEKFISDPVKIKVNPNLTTMKIISFFLMAFSVLTVSAQSGSPKTEVLVNGKTFEKYNGIIVNKNTKSPNTGRVSTRSEQSHSPEYIYEITNYNVYLITKDSEIKDIFKNILPGEILKKCSPESITMQLQINSRGKVEHITFFVGDGSLYDMDIKVYSDIEDAVKARFQFHIPDKSVPIYYFTLPPLKITNLTSEKELFPETLYRERR